MCFCCPVLFPLCARVAAGLCQAASNRIFIDYFIMDVGFSEYFGEYIPVKKYFDIRKFIKMQEMEYWKGCFIGRLIAVLASPPLIIGIGGREIDRV